MKIEIVNYSQGPVSINKELWNSRQLEGSGVSMRPQLRCVKGSDSVGFQIDLAASVDDKEALSLGFLFGMRVEGWGKVTESHPDPDSLRPYINDICYYFWATATGAIAAITSRDNGRPLILPPIDPDKFIPLVIITISSESQA